MSRHAGRSRAAKPLPSMSNVQFVQALNADLRRLGVPTDEEFRRVLASDLRRLGMLRG